MRCDYSYQLSPVPCQSIDKRATLAFFIECPGAPPTLVSLCPVCAGPLEENLRKTGIPYQRQTIHFTTVSDGNDIGVNDSDDEETPDFEDGAMEPEPPEVDPC